MQRRPLPDCHGGQVCATHDLVAPLASTATAMRSKDMDFLPNVDRSSCAVSALIGSSLRSGDVDSADIHSTSPTPATPGTSTSTTATRTTGTRTTSSGLAPSADDGADIAPA